MGHYHRLTSTKSVIRSSYIVVLALINALPAICETTQPNIVIIMADDMGFSDVSMHGSEIPTPNIDALGMNGLILNRFYTPIMCTPSRSSLLTGRYPIHTGMQHYVISQDQPWGLGLFEKLMPEVFREAGYSTHLIGKWHLGLSQRTQAPNSRGFDTFFGYLGAYIDYWDHTVYLVNKNYSRGLDLRRDFEVAYEYEGVYATHMFTTEAKRTIQQHETRQPLFLLLNHIAPHTGNEDKPMQAPEERINRFSYIRNEKRRTMAAMVSELDDGVGEVVTALEEKGILNNTIILFYSDNGAPTQGLHANMGSNFPFRGQKNTPWEGAMRVPAAIWAPNIPKSRVSGEWMHVTDVFPTLAAAAGISLDDMARRLDGVNHWSSLTSGSPGPRNEMFHNIDDIFAYRMMVKDGWKLVYGTTLDGLYDDHLGDFIEPTDKMNASYYFEVVHNSLTNQVLGRYNTPLDSVTVERLRSQATVICQDKLPEASECRALESPCLFDLKVDPCERNNLALLYPERVEELTDLLDAYAQTAETPRNKPSDPAADPRYYNNTWTYWLDLKKEESHISRNVILWIVLASIGIMGAILLVGGTLIAKSSHEYRKTKY